MFAKVPAGLPAVLREEGFGAGKRSRAFVVILGFVAFEWSSHVAGDDDLVEWLAADKEDCIITDEDERRDSEDSEQSERYPAQNHASRAMRRNVVEVGSGGSRHFLSCAHGLVLASIAAGLPEWSCAGSGSFNATPVRRLLHASRM